MIDKTSTNGLNHQPTEFIIEEFRLFSFASGNEIDIRLIALELNIYENLFENTISGDIVVNDANNLISKLPIYGHEYLFLNFYSPVDNVKYKKVFRVYKIANREPETDRYHYYQLFFSSVQDIMNEGSMISKSYINDSTSNIASDIFKSYLKTEQSPDLYYVEETKNKFDIVFPNVDTFTALNYLASRSVGISRSGSSHVFFENRNGFLFCSLEFLLEQSPITTINYDPKNIRYLDSPADLDFNKDVKSAEIFVFKNTIDILSNVHNGMYVNTIYGHDILHKIKRNYKFDYVEEYKNFVHLEEGEDKKLGGTEFSPNDGKNSSFTFLPFEAINNSTEKEITEVFELETPRELDETFSLEEKSNTIEYVESEEMTEDEGQTPREPKTTRSSAIEVIDGEDLTEEEAEYTEDGEIFEISGNDEEISLFSREHWEETEAQRNSILHAIQENVRVSVALPGSVDYTVGDLIEFYPPSNEPINQEIDFKPDILLSGKYLIVNVRHKIGANAFFTFLELTKDCFYSDLPY